jgi:hypothetical protein
MKSLIRVCAVFLAVTAMTGVAAAAPITLNFDTDLGGNPIAPNTSVNTAYPLAELSFSSNSLVVMTGTGVPSLPNFASGDPLYTGTIEVIFSPDFVGDLIGAENVTGSTWTLTAYDNNNNVLGTIGSPAFGNPAAVLSFPGQIRRATFTTNSQYGIDNLIFEASPVPEPASLAVWSMLLLSVAGASVYLKRLNAATPVLN